TPASAYAAVHNLRKLTFASLNTRASSFLFSLSLELQLQQLLLQPASHLHRPALWLDVPPFAFVGSERDDLVSKVNVFPSQVIQQAGLSGSSIHGRNEHC